ncbi:hypothetical protein cyc_03065 [Cyclospora cayetanensis]|uniref:UTP23 sensor motif region domain-containing protein n=1 Tax=Cyclospora cayetanensis TaxID=88456 RepID=A0A1D3CWV7_9EIME|nr:hypothetical protein cyc_03065 [Cyclospora cayetanensis]
MRVARKKSFKKIMRFYATHFGIQEPYQLIGMVHQGISSVRLFVSSVDGTFLAACIRHKVNVAELLPRVLCDVTPCIMKEVRTLPGAQGAAAAAKRYKRRVPGLPLLFLFKGVLQVEQPTKFSLVRAQQQQRASAKGPLAAAAAEKRRLAADRKQQLEKLQQQGVDCSGLLLQQQKEELQKQRELERAAKRKRKKGVNPLACRKSTKMIIEAPKLSDGKKVRSRRVKLSKEDVKPEGS